MHVSLQEDSNEQAALQAAEIKTKQENEEQCPAKTKDETKADASNNLGTESLSDNISSQFNQAFSTKLYTSVFSIFEMPPEILQHIYSENFMKALITNSLCEEAEFNIQKQEGCETYFFEGYPSGNYIK